VAYAVLGFGINLYPWAEASAQAGPAAPLFDALPDEKEREAVKTRLLEAVLARFWEYYTALPEKRFMEAYRERSVLTGKTVSVFAPTDKERVRPLYTATVLGIDEEGALLVRTAAGEEKRLTGGEVSLGLQA
jgi:biotin-(acetyl-CoA carboxylase) ligase